MCKEITFSFVCVILLFFPVYGLRRNDSCLIEGIQAVGVCRPFLDCEYATRLVNQEKRHPPHCGWEGNDEIVCCPLVDKPFTAGDLRNAFQTTDNGVLRSRDVTCIYDGSVPAICCPNKDSTRVEPRGCPPLTKPRTNFNHIIWSKCQEYQRYVDVCTHTVDRRRFVRLRKCAMSAYGDRISGGTPARRAEFPHMAVLGCRGDSPGSVKWVSGGSLISDRFILTAAHAIFSKEYGNVQYALMGVLNKNDVSKGVLHNIVGYEQYKLYNKNEKYHDIALLTLFPRVEFSNLVRPACLPLPNAPISDSRVVAGWGETQSVAGSESDVLLKAYIQEFPASECRYRIDSQGLSRGWDAKTMICAGGKQGEANDSCRGDSGGPLMAYLDDHEIPCTYVVRGLVSWGPDCGRGAPGVYTNVQHRDYLDWIVKKLWLTGEEDALD